MEHVESTTTAEVMDGMEIDSTNAQAQTEVTAENVAESLLRETPAQEEASDVAQTEEQTDVQDEPEQTPEEARKSEVEKGVNALYAAGWSGEELTAFSEDAQARADIANGKSVEQAAMAYLMRMTRGEGAGEAPKVAKKKSGVPVMRQGATAPVQKSISVEDMDDEAFARFSKRAQDLARGGAKVLIK